MLEEFGWDLEELTSCNLQGASTTFRSTCPECYNGSRHEDCFAVTVQADEKDVQVPARPVSVVWCCHRANCGFTGGVSLHTKLITGASQQQQQQSEGPWQRAQHHQQQLLQAQVQQLQQQGHAQLQLQLQAQPGQQLARQQPSVTRSLELRPSSGQLPQLPQAQVNTELVSVRQLPSSCTARAASTTQHVQSETVQCCTVSAVLTAASLCCALCRRLAQHHPGSWVRALGS